MSDNDYNDSDGIGKLKLIEIRWQNDFFLLNSVLDDDCYDPYDDDGADPFQDDNNNNYTTNVINNDPEYFQYTVHKFDEIQSRLEPTIFPSSFVENSSTEEFCSICLKKQNDFESLICRHAFCRACWIQYIETNFKIQFCTSSFDLGENFSFV